MLPAISLLISIVFFCAPQLALAAQQDGELPLNIEADQLKIDEKKGSSIYSGHVKISRGSLLIKGDRVIIQTEKNNGLKSIQVEGSPASFRQRNDEGQLISAQAQKMMYQNHSGVLTLNQDAELVQKQNTFRAEKIIYNTRTDIVQAGAKDPHKKDSGGNERVFITIHPDTPAKTEQP